jgi:hypothetical protein
LARRGVGGVDLHCLAVAGLFEYFRRHVARRPARSGEDMELLFVHYPRESEVCYQEICIVFWRSEEKIFGLEVAVDDAMVM